MTSDSGLWHHADFRALWSAQTVSQVGTQVTQIALPLTAISVLSATPLQVGLLTTLAFLPFLLVGLPAGVWVDRLRHRRVMIVANAGRALTLGVVPLAYAADALELWLLYVAAFGTGVLTVFFDVAYASYLPHLVDRNRLMEGNSKLEASRTAAMIVGPGLGGWLVRVVGAPVAILADAISYVAAAVLLLLVRKADPPVSAPADGRRRPGLLPEIREGQRFVLGHPLLRPIVTCTATLNLAFGAMQAVLLLHAVRELGMDPTAVSIVLVGTNVGGLTGAVLSRRLVRAAGVGRTIIGAVAGYAVGATLLPAAAGPVSLGLVTAGTFITAGCAMTYNIAQVSLRQAVTPHRLQGRMNSTMRFVVWGVIPVGAVLGGLGAGTIGTRAVLWLTAPFGLLALLGPLTSRLRDVREIPVAEPEPEPEPRPVPGAAAPEAGPATTAPGAPGAPAPVPGRTGGGAR